MNQIKLLKLIEGVRQAMHLRLECGDHEIVTRLSATIGLPSGQRKRLISLCVLQGPMDWQSLRK